MLIMPKVIAPFQIGRGTASFLSSVGPASLTHAPRPPRPNCEGFHCWRRLYGLGWRARRDGIMVVPARVLSAVQSADLARAAVILIRGGIVALPFNGTFALFGDVEQPHVYSRIMVAKGRLADQRLAQVCLPEHARELVDFNVTAAPERKIAALWHEVHSLGLILPANRRGGVTVQERGPTDGTVLVVWTEYHPLRKVLEQFRALG